MCSNKILLTALATFTALNLLNMNQLASAAAPTNACALLSQSQVRTSLGAEVDAGKNIIGAGDCRWTERGKSTGADVKLLQVNLIDAKAFELGKTPLPKWNKAPTTGLGDGAYIADSGKITFPISPSLTVKKGAVFFVVVAKVPKANLEQTKDVEKTVASLILEQF